MNRIVIVIFIIINIQSCIAQSPCKNTLLTDKIWILSKVDNERVFFDQNRKIFNKKGEYILNSSEIQVKLTAENQLDIDYVNYDGLYESTSSTKGTWNCKEEKQELIFIDNPLQISSIDGVKKYYKFVVEKLNHNNLVLRLKIE